MTIGDDGDAGFLGLGQNSAECLTVDGSDNQSLAAVGYHVLDLRNLSVTAFGIKCRAIRLAEVV